MLPKFKYTKESFIKIVSNIHNNKYSYENIDFIRTTDKININCSQHGFFEQKASEHLLGKGCRKCYFENKKSNIYSFIQKSNIIYNNQFNYNKFNYIDSKFKSTIVCRYGHEFERSPNRHLKGDDYCNICKINSYTEEKLKSIDFGGFEYLEWVGAKVNIKCNDCHNIFNRKISQHKKLKNCPFCNPNKDTRETFIKKSKIIHNNEYNYSDLVYNNSKSKIILTCSNNHKFEQMANNHLNGTGCPKCNRFNKKENYIYDFIKENYDGLNIQSDRSILSGKELDIYLPELNLAFEFNGLYWHSDVYKDKKYHLQKTKDCLEQGIQLVHIWEDDYNIKLDIIKSIVLNKLGKSHRIFARKCKIEEVNNRDVREFLIKNHIQGFVGSKIKLGLYYNDELVSLMTFGNLRKSLGQAGREGSYELLRFCNKLGFSVIGGASKLFKYFLNNYEVTEVISYSDSSRGIGNLYIQLGFEFISDTIPNYYWIVNGIRKHRFNFRKDKLVKEGNDPLKTEIQIMNGQGYNRIFDCGNKKWIYRRE